MEEKSVFKKVYEAPAMEVVELETAGVIAASKTGYDSEEW